MRQNEIDRGLGKRTKMKKYYRKNDAEVTSGRSQAICPCTPMRVHQRAHPSLKPSSVPPPPRFADRHQRSSTSTHAPYTRTHKAHSQAKPMDTSLRSRTLAIIATRDGAGLGAAVGARRFRLARARLRVVSVAARAPSRRGRAPGRVSVARVARAAVVSRARRAGAVARRVVGTTRGRAGRRALRPAAAGRREGSQVHGGGRIPNGGAHR